MSQKTELNLKHPHERKEEIIRRKRGEAEKIRNRLMLAQHYNNNNNITNEAEDAQSVYTVI